MRPAGSGLCHICFGQIKIKLLQDPSNSVWKCLLLLQNGPYHYRAEHNVTRGLLSGAHDASLVWAAPETHSLLNRIWRADNHFKMCCISGEQPAALGLISKAQQKDQFRPLANNNHHNHNRNSNNNNFSYLWSTSNYFIPVVNHPENENIITIPVWRDAGGAVV